MSTVLRDVVDAVPFAGIRTFPTTSRCSSLAALSSTTGPGLPEGSGAARFVQVADADRRGPTDRRSGA
jgi:hypothetical protein